MSMTDPLADMLTRIRNACKRKFETVDIPLSNIKLGVAEILKKEGYIRDFHVQNDTIPGVLRIELKYTPDKQGVIYGLKRVSKPGRRKYVRAEGVPSVLNGLGIAILSTSKGIVSDKMARENHVGGEVICEVW